MLLFTTDIKDTLPLWPKISSPSKCSDFFSRYTSWYADSYEIKFEMPFHATFRVRSLAKSSLLGRDLFKILCVYRKDSSWWWPKPVFQQKTCDFCLIYTSKHTLPETYNFMRLFQTFLRFWKQKNYMIWWNVLVRHCIFSHFEGKHSTLFPHMETHPNFLNESTFRVPSQVTFSVSTNRK